MNIIIMSHNENNSLRLQHLIINTNKYRFGKLINPKYILNCKENNLVIVQSEMITFLDDLLNNNKLICIIERRTDNWNYYSNFEKIENNKNYYQIWNTDLYNYNKLNQLFNWLNISQKTNIDNDDLNYHYVEDGVFLKSKCKV